jgi:hypothetical protein
MTSYNYQYNPTFENQAMDRSSQVFWDAVSITSSDRNSIAMSIYHSVPELRHDEQHANALRHQQVSEGGQNRCCDPNESEMTRFRLR